MLLRLALVLVLSALAAGCGGEERVDEGPVGEAARCLERLGADVTTDPAELGFVASTAVGGALKAEIGTNDVTISFGETSAEAKSLVKAYRRFADEGSLRGILGRRGRAVLLWGHRPTPSEAETAALCLQ